MTRKSAIKVLDEYIVTVTLEVSASSKAKALDGVRSCLGVSAPRITGITVKSGDRR